MPVADGSAAPEVPTIATQALAPAVEVPPIAVAKAEDPAVERAEEKRLLNAALGECGTRMKDRERRRIAATIVGAAERHGFDPLFIQAIVEVESMCSPTARSPDGAMGLIQIQPATAHAVAKRNGIPFKGAHELMRPEVNVEVGLSYLIELEEMFADPYLAVAAYNLGPGRVAAMSPSRARRSHYVRRVLARYETLLRDHADPVTARS